MDLDPRLADGDQNHSTPSVLMLGTAVNRPQMAGKCLSLERKDFTPTGLGDGSAQVISSYLPIHACEVLVLVLMLVPVLVLVLVLMPMPLGRQCGTCAIHDPAAPHVKLRYEGVQGPCPRPLLLEGSIWTAFTPTPCQDHCHYGKDGMPGCQTARMQYLRTVLTISDRRLSEAALSMHRTRCMRR